MRPDGDRRGARRGPLYLQGRGVTDEAIAAFHLGYASTAAATSPGLPSRPVTRLTCSSSSASWGPRNRARLRPLPRPGHLPHPQHFGQSDCIREDATSREDWQNISTLPNRNSTRRATSCTASIQARSAIVREDKCFLVEGYMDVIGMWQSGMKNVVASSGTALTDGQIALIHRFTDNITLIYDGDAAGVKGVSARYRHAPLPQDECQDAPSAA